MKAKLETLSVSVLREFAKDKNIKNISTMRKSEPIDAIIAAAEREEKKEPAEVEDVVFEDAGAEHDVAGISDESHHKSEQYVKEDKKDNTYYIENNNQRYMLKEYNYGTIIYSPLVNLINEVKDLEEINTLIIDLSYTDDISIIDKYINKEVINNTYKGFFNTKTIYKLKDE